MLQAYFHQALAGHKQADKLGWPHAGEQTRPSAQA
jgi:hypothetical protein